MARGDQLQRQWALLKRLQTHGQGLSLRDLAEGLGVSERTIQRDFELLGELGFPVEHEDDEYGKRFWRLPHDFFRTGPLVVTLSEAVSLHLAESLIAPLSGTHFSDGFASLLGKIRGSIPQPALDYFSGLDQIVHVRRTAVPRYTAHAATIRLLTDAINQHRSLEVSYHSLWRNDQYQTRFDPYGLVLYDSELFVCGRSHKAEAFRIFKVARIESAALSEHAFVRPEGFDLEAQFRDAFGVTHTDEPTVEIAVRFTGPAAALVQERIWHDSQRLEWLPSEDALFDMQTNESDGVLATFRLAEVAEFKRWLKGFGDRCAVVRPDWLRHQMRDELSAALALYE